MSDPDRPRPSGSWRRGGLARPAGSVRGTRAGPGSSGRPIEGPRRRRGPVRPRRVVRRPRARARTGGPARSVRPAADHGHRRIGRISRPVPVRSRPDLRHEPGQLAAARPEQRGQGTGSTSRKSARNASTNGPYGSPPVPSGRQPPLRTRAPDPHLVGECRHQTRLADPGLARDDDDPRLAGAARA